MDGVEALTPVAQDYLKVIWAATEWGDPPITTKGLAARFGTTQANVSETVRRLAAQGLVTYEPYRPVVLTERGVRLATAMVRRHRLIECFLAQILGYGWDEVHDEAERLEHAVTDDFLTRIDRLLGFPRYDPHGDPIPGADGSLPAPVAAVRLTEAEPGLYVVARVSDADPDALARLRSRGLTPGIVVETTGLDQTDSDLAAVHVRLVSASRDDQLVRQCRAALSFSTESRAKSTALLSQPGFYADDVRLDCHPHIADPQSPLGMLQRGRGAGWLAAVAHPEQGRQNMLTCLRNDPREDRQVESRGEYYGSLALALGVEPADVAAVQASDDGWLRQETLAAMFARGRVEAADYFDDLLEHSWSEPSDDVASQATPPPPPSDAPVERLLQELRSGPLPRAIVHRFRVTRDQAELEAIRAAALDPSGPSFRLAVRLLGVRGDAFAVPAVSALLATNPRGAVHAASLRYLEELPADVTLPLAREWLGLPDGRGDAANSLLAAHAEAEDVSRIRRQLAIATDYYAICALVDALARAPEQGPYPELRTLFAGTCHSYAPTPRRGGCSN